MSSFPRTTLVCFDALPGRTDGVETEGVRPFPWRTTGFAARVCDPEFAVRRTSRGFVPSVDWRRAERTGIRSMMESIGSVR